MRVAIIAMLLLVGVLGGCTTVSNRTTGVTTGATLTAIIPTPTAITQEARDYLEEAFDFVRDNFVKRKSVDWAALHTKVFAAAAHARTPSDTYPAIQLLMDSLQSNHSFFAPPDANPNAGVRGGYGYVLVLNPQRADTYIVALVYPSSPAEQGGLKAGDIIIAQEQTTNQITLHIQRKGAAQPLTLTLQRGIYDTTIAPTGQRLGKHVGYITIPGFVGGTDAGTDFATTLQGVIKSLDGADICGWLVDVRRDTGGVTAPMIAGVGPIVGEGKLGAYVSDDFNQSWSYQNGVESVDGQPQVTVAQPYHTAQANLPVALLTSQATSSAGETVVISFAGRPNTRRIGEATTGVPVAPNDHTMPDKATVVVTNVYEADRTGHNYGEAPIPPEQAVTADWTQFGTASDPTIQAGLQWLQASAGCAG